METTKNVQELKAERVQEERVAEPVRRGMLFVDVADEPAWVNLKAERVQEPASLAEDGRERHTSYFELAISQKQPVTIELPAVGVVIKLHGVPAEHSAPGNGSGAGSAGQPQAA